MEPFSLVTVMGGEFAGQRLALLLFGGRLWGLGGGGGAEASEESLFFPALSKASSHGEGRLWVREVPSDQEAKC